MIEVHDNFLPWSVVDEFNTVYTSDRFSHQEHGNKSFYVAPSTASFEELVWERIDNMYGQTDRVFSFIRKSTNWIDTDWNIHADYDIIGKRPEKAAVLYLSPESPDGGLYGTALWSLHGDEKHAITKDDFEYALGDDVTNNLDVWNLDQLVTYKQNRLVIYDANRYHSAFPNKAWKEGRISMSLFFNEAELPF